MANDRTIPSDQPTDLATFDIFSDGEQLPASRHLLMLSVVKSVNKISYARLVLKDGDPSVEDFPLSNTEFFKPGRQIEVRLGYHNDNVTIFKGMVIKHGIKAHPEKGSILNIECKDKAVKMTAGRQNKFFREMTDSDIFEEIIGKYGLEKEVETTSQSHKEMVQYYATDWDFLIARGEMNGMVVIPSDGKLVIKKPSIGEPALELTFGATILDIEAEMDARNLFPAAKSFSWDYADQQLTETEGESASLDQAGNISEDDLAQVLELQELELRHSGHRINTELQSWSDAFMLKSRLSKIRGRAKCQGFSGIKPGDTLKLNGVGERFNGKVFVAGVSHQLSTGKWVTDIEFGLSPKWFYKEDDIGEVAAAGLIPPVNGLQIGVVTQLQDDPEGEDRILVKVPIIDKDDEGIWVRVATLDAGENRGSFFRPEIGDEVLVGFVNDDPRDAVVLGMLHSSAKPAPVTASDDNHEKGFVTREQLKLMFDDEKKSIIIETPNGNKLTLSDAAGGIKIEDENSNVIELNSGGIKLESPGDIAIKASGDVKIEGNNVSQKAGAQFKAEGSAGAEVSSSATAKLKGAIVQIN